MTTEKKKELRRAILFTLFSLSAGIIQAGSFALMNGLLKWPYWVSHLIALTLSVIWNFTLNRNVTFQSAGNVPVAMLKVAVFYAVFTPLSTVGGNLLVGIGWNDFLVEALMMLSNFVLEFLYDRFVVFGKTMDTREKKEQA
ncbi:MAG: GtrA family protein [Clostridia bacterium]|nr:GtrA family protein [Clostridia bacterium]